MRFGPGTWPLWLVMVIGSSCGGEGSYRLQVSFPDGFASGCATRLIISALWNTENEMCELLMSGEIDPVDLQVISNQVLNDPQDGTANTKLPEVPNGDLVFFVEGETSRGTKIVIGCAEAEVRSGATVNVNLEMVCVRECGPEVECEGSCGSCGDKGSCWAGKCILGEWLTIESAGQSFAAGSPLGEPGRVESAAADETLHQVSLTRDFMIWSTEVTQEWYREVTGTNPSHFTACGDDCPVETVNWHEAAAFCNALSEDEDLPICYQCQPLASPICELNPSFTTPYDCSGYRLPTEAEWEFAARAGIQTATTSGDIDANHLECEEGNTILEPLAWFCANNEGGIHPVTEKDPNDWGLYDTLGNAWEWCHDWYAMYAGDVEDPWGTATGTYRVRRGGSWLSQARDCRLARRLGEDPVLKYNKIGFRPCRTVDNP